MRWWKAAAALVEVDGFAPEEVAGVYLNTYRRFYDAAKVAERKDAAMRAAFRMIVSAPGGWLPPEILAWTGETPTQAEAEADDADEIALGEVMIATAPAYRLEGDDNHIYVRSQSGSHGYTVQLHHKTGSPLFCSCKAGFYGNECWHKRAALVAGPWEDAVRTLWSKGRTPTEIAAAWKSIRAQYGAKETVQAMGLFVRMHGRSTA